MNKSISIVFFFVAACKIQIIYPVQQAGYDSTSVVHYLSGTVDSVVSEMKEIKGDDSKINIKLNEGFLIDFIARSPSLESIIGLDISAAVMQPDDVSAATKWSDKVVKRTEQLANLENFALKWKGLTEIPAVMMQWKKTLKMIDFSYNYLNKKRALDNLKQFPNLEELTLRWNDLEDPLPMIAVCKKLPNLKVLDVGGNFFSEESIGCIKTSLGPVEIRGCSSQSVKKRIVGLDISGNGTKKKCGLPELEKKINQLGILDQLILKWRNLEKIPAVTAPWKKTLKMIDLSYNSLHKKGALENLKQFPNLEELILRWNDLKDPSSIIEICKKLPNLKILDIGGNFFSKESIKHIQHELKDIEIRGGLDQA